MDFWREHIKIGKFYFPRFIGGPLDKITDSPFRQLVREFSHDELLYTEMRHVACVSHDKTGVHSLKFDQGERPLNYQVAANKVEFIEPALEKILAAGVDMIDLNIGCPARNVISSGSGSALMADIPRLTAILKKFRALLTIPFTVKIRAGFKECNALEVAQIAQDCGVDALAIHPRLQTQKFEGRPNYALAAQVKKALTIPVIISGGIVNWTTAKIVYEQTGVDGFLIGRGIWGRPWKLKELQEHALGNPYTIDKKTVLRCALKHLESMLAYYGPHGLFAFRKHIPFYIQGIPGASSVRSELVQTQSVDTIKDGLMHVLQ